MIQNFNPDAKKDTIDNHETSSTLIASFVEIKVCLRLLHISSVALLEVLGEDDIPVFADSMHASFLTDSSNLN